MDLFTILSTLEVKVDIHLARLLILLSTFKQQDGQHGVEGLTKLAKLDFFLRYPVYLERALRIRGADENKVAVQEFERQSIESRMVRFKYGPWDFRYRLFINLLVAKGLASISGDRRTVHICLTTDGVRMAEELKEDQAFIDLSARAQLLKRHLNLGGTSLMQFVYEHFPEVATLRLGDDIQYER